MAGGAGANPLGKTKHRDAAQKGAYHSFRRWPKQLGYYTGWYFVKIDYVVQNVICCCFLVKGIVGEESRLSVIVEDVCFVCCISFMGSY